MTTYRCKDLPNGKHACILPMTFGKWRIVVGPPGHKILEDGF